MAEDDLPDPLHPGHTAPLNLPADAPALPRGDLRAATWVALVTAVLVVAWYLTVLLTGGVSLPDAAAATVQVTAWVLAIVSFVCGVLCLNARRHREFAAAGFIAGVVALLVSVTLGLSAGLQIVF